MIFISAGHHPSKPGACFGSFCEHDEAAIWARAIADALEAEASFVPPGVLRDKVAFINSRSPSIAVEIHFNSAMRDGKHVGEGCETLYYPGSHFGKLLAKEIQSRMSVVYPPGRGVKEGYYRMDPKRGPDFFLAKTKCPSVIVEPEFIHRKEIIQEKRDEGIAAIVGGILAYLGEQ